MNPVKCGVCPYMSEGATGCEAAGVPLLALNACPQKKIREKVKNDDANRKRRTGSARGTNPRSVNPAGRTSL